MAAVLRLLGRSRWNAAQDGSGSPDQQGGAEASGEEGPAAEAPAAQGALAAVSEDECQMLIDMGFDEEQVKEALEASRGDVSEAVGVLLSSGPAQGQEEPPAPGRQGSGSPEQFSMEELDAVLNEALRASEKEAEEENNRREEEQRSLDAALAASLECLGPGPAAQESPAQESPPSQQPERSTGLQKDRSSPDLHLRRRPLNDGELCEKVLSASSRRQQLEPLRPLRHRPHEGSSSSSPSGHQQIAGLPPLIGAKGLAPLPGEVRTPQFQHSSSKGTPTRQQQQEARSSAATESRPLSSSTGVASNAAGSHAGEELVALDDLEGWNRGSGLFGVASLRSTYPARLLPVAASRHQQQQQQQQPTGMTPRRRISGEGRPNSRAARQGLGNSSSSPLLAAAALSIS
mmetsp:Transcript_41631/g.129516  ORF Transcript_41631/g.129516 Transcript_41631/m.129516 type:complete len:403 (-) Transcript_41631:113-1321(-)